MKIAAAVTLLASSSSVTAFAPSTSISNRITTTNNDNRICSSSSCLSMNVPFFASEEKTEEASPAPTAEAVPEEEELDNMTVEQEVELMVQQELQKTKRISNLRNENGVEFAPWMGITEEKENEIRSLMRDKTEARRKRQLQEQDVSGNLFRDSQAQELSGTGLSYKILNGDVELTWATKTETDTKGFIVKRRAAKTNDYSVIASYNDFGPLVSKGKEGGVYRYLDTTAEPGGWVYRISEADSFGNEADVCQCLVEVETEAEQKGAIIAGVGFGVFAIAAFVAGVAMDPMNGY